MIFFNYQINGWKKIWCDLTCYEILIKYSSENNLVW